MRVKNSRVVSFSRIGGCQAPIAATAAARRTMALPGSGAEPWPENVAALAWVSAEDFGDYAFPSADQKTVELLLRDH